MLTFFSKYIIQIRNCKPNQMMMATSNESIHRVYVLAIIKLLADICKLIYGERLTGNMWAKLWPSVSPSVTHTHTNRESELSSDVCRSLWHS